MLGFINCLDRGRKVVILSICHVFQTCMAVFYSLYETALSNHLLGKLWIDGKAFKVSCSSCPPVRHQDWNLVLSSQTCRHVCFTWQDSVVCLRKMIFSVALFPPHLDVASEGLCECPPWGIMNLNGRKTNTTPLGTALEAQSILSFVTLCSPEGCKATLLLDKHFHIKQACLVYNADMVLLELLLSRFVCRK